MINSTRTRIYDAVQAGAICSRYMHLAAARDICDLQLMFGNWYTQDVNFLVYETGNSGPITVRASVEYPAGTFMPVFFNGKRDVVIDPKGNVTSDSLGIEIPAGAQFFTRTYVTGAQIVTGAPTQEAQGEGVGAGDQTLGGTITPSDSAGYGPVAILSDTPWACKSVAIFGDSIGDGYNDIGGDANGNLGYVPRALGNAVGWTRLTRPGDASLFWGNANRFARMDVVKHCTHAIIALGTNDLGVMNLSAGYVQAELSILWKALTCRGLKVWQCTLPPFTTSTDLWTTTAGQSVVASYEPRRVQVNDWMRTTPQYLAGYFEVADALETSRNSGLWKATGAACGYTNDGVHPSTHGYEQGALSIDVGRL